MKLEVRNRCSDFNGYRAARVKSLFNAESGANFSLDADLPIEDLDWKLGVIVGPSGSGKTSLGRQVFGEDAMYDPPWPADRPIVDAIAPAGDFDAVTGALAAVGLGDVPTWLRPYAVLSNGEKFRATLARLVAEAPERAVVDEFTSVVDRQIAKFGALAFVADPVSETSDGWYSRSLRQQAASVLCGCSVAESSEDPVLVESLGELA